MAAPTIEQVNTWGAVINEARSRLRAPILISRDSALILVVDGYECAFGIYEISPPGTREGRLAAAYALMSDAIQIARVREALRPGEPIRKALDAWTKIP